MALQRGDDLCHGSSRTGNRMNRIGALLAGDGPVVIQVPRRRAHERVPRGRELRRQVVAREVRARVHREDDDVGIPSRRAVEHPGQGEAVGRGVVHEIAPHGGVDRAVAVRKDDAFG